MGAGVVPVDAGHRDLVAPLALAATAAGADGLLIEVHPDPDRSATDAEQTISTENFAGMLRRIRSVHKSIQSCETTRDEEGGEAVEQAKR